VLRQQVTGANIGTTFSCAPVQPHDTSEKSVRAAMRMDVLLNRLFIEPALGMGYPKTDLPFLKRIEDYFMPDDRYKLQFDFDFTGVQNYTREIVRSSFFTPFLRAQVVPAARRNVPLTAMGWEIYPESIYLILKQFSQYKSIK
jgi:beta-glucosidase